MGLSSLVRRAPMRLLLLAIVLAAGLPAAPAQAATELAYVSATGHYMRGAFRDFWDKNGGLANFGYPITEEYIDPQNERIYQYFERARFERAAPNATAVDLGLLGRQALGNRTIAPAQPIANSAQRRYFPQTQQIVQYGFKETWEGRGGLKIFGYPISGELEEQLADGKVHTVQYFERARFEYWPDRPAGQRVLLSLLGRQFAPKDLLAPLPPGAPPAGPIAYRPNAGAPLVRPLLPASKNAQVVPQAGLPGTIFYLGANGFRPGEQVGLWVNSPDGSIYGAQFQVTADARGSITDAQISFRSSPDLPLGVWSFVGQGVDSGNQAVGYFLLIGDAIGRLPAPEPEPSQPPDIDARVEPGAGRPGTIFFFDAWGFTPGEEVSPQIVAPDGTVITVDYTVKADEQGSIGYAGLYYVTEIYYPLGLWRFEAKGNSSGKLSVAHFALTR